MYVSPSSISKYDVCGYVYARDSLRTRRKLKMILNDDGERSNSAHKCKRTYKTWQTGLYKCEYPTTINTHDQTGVCGTENL